MNGAISPQDLSLAELVRRASASDLALAGRQQAFVALVERFQDGAYGYALALLGDPHLAQDATQEAFVVAYRQLDQLRVPEAFAGWLRRIVRTHCARLRRGKEPGITSLDVAEFHGHPLEPLTPTPSAVRDPVIAAEVAELRTIMATALEALPLNERMAAVLFYVADYSQEEMARFLEVPVNTIKKRLQSARKRLRERMTTMMDDALRDHAREYLPSRDDNLIENVRFLAAFDAAASDGEMRLIELLLVDGVDVDNPDRDGRTLLSWAAQRGNLDAVGLLLQHNARVNARDRAGSTPLAWAERAGQRTAAALLRRHGGTL